MDASVNPHQKGYVSQTSYGLFWEGVMVEVVVVVVVMCVCMSVCVSVCLCVCLCPSSCLYDPCVLSHLISSLNDV